MNLKYFCLEYGPTVPQGHKPRTLFHSIEKCFCFDKKLFYKKISSRCILAVILILRFYCKKYYGAIVIFIWVHCLVTVTFMSQNTLVHMVRLVVNQVYSLKQITIILVSAEMVSIPHCLK